MSLVTYIYKCNSKEYKNQYVIETELSTVSMENSKQNFNFLQTGTSDLDQNSLIKQNTNPSIINVNSSLKENQVPNSMKDDNQVGNILIYIEYK